MRGGTMTDSQKLDCILSEVYGLKEEDRKSVV